MAAKATHDAVFIKEKETPNTVRYQEQTEDGKPPVIGSLYLQKWFAGARTTVRVVLEAE